jgi:hypothetical protein
MFVTEDRLIGADPSVETPGYYAPELPAMMVSQSQLPPRTGHAP